jgi:hypothetical protein
MLSFNASFVFDNSGCYCAHPAYYSLDGGNTWVNITDVLAGQTVGSGASITFKSDDSGNPIQSVITYTLNNGSQQSGSLGEVYTGNIEVYGIQVWCCLTGDMIIDESEEEKKKKKKRCKKTRLDEIKPDAKIFALNLDTGNVEEQSVKGLENKYTGFGEQWADCYQVYTFSDGTIIKEVNSHRFFNATRMQFMYMKDWLIGDLIYKMDGTTPSLIKVLKIKLCKCD